MHTYTHEYTDTIACLACCNEVVLPTHCDTLQGTATNCNMQTHTCKRQHTDAVACLGIFLLFWTHRNNKCSGVLDDFGFLNTHTQATFSFCNARTQTAAHRCSGVLSDFFCSTHCNTLQHTATHCNTLQYTATCQRTHTSNSTQMQWRAWRIFSTSCACVPENPVCCGRRWCALSRCLASPCRWFVCVLYMYMHVYMCIFEYFYACVCICIFWVEMMRYAILSGEPLQLIYVFVSCIYVCVYIRIYKFTHVYIFKYAYLYIYVCAWFRTRWYTLPPCLASPCKWFTRVYCINVYV